MSTQTAAQADAATQGLRLVRHTFDHPGEPGIVDAALLPEVCGYLAGVVAELLRQSARRQGRDPEALLDRLECHAMSQTEVSGG